MAVLVSTKRCVLQPRLEFKVCCIACSNTRPCRGHRRRSFRKVWGYGSLMNAYETSGPTFAICAPPSWTDPLQTLPASSRVNGAGYCLELLRISDFRSKADSGPRSLSLARP